MGDLKGHAAVLFWIILVIDAERWYSATLQDSEPHNFLYFGPSKAVYKAYNENKYLPVSMVMSRNQTKKNELSFTRRHDVTTSVPPPLKVYNEKITKFPFLYKHLNKSSPKLDKVVAEKFTYGDAIPIKSSNTSTRPPTFQINKTITNLNIIRKPKPSPEAKPTNKPKRKMVRRCPTVRPRQKKQLDPNQSIQKRFLEVFEVVEFDHVTCVSSSGLEGTCLPEFDCQSSGGAPMGTCADGFGTCCVTQFSCDDYSAATSGWFVNPGFPSPSTERLSCVFTLHKSSPDIQQFRLDFKNFELLAPTAGTCEQDQFMVTGQNVNNVIPIICGVNTGQHVYIEVGDVDGPITFSIQTVSSDSRLFSIKISQLTAVDELAAPSGCLQYFKTSQGYLESFNYRDKSDIAIARSPSYLNNLNYAMCIERATETCSVTYTNTGTMQIVNYDSDGLPVIPPMQAGVEIFNCPTDWLLMAAVRVCGERLNDGSVLQDFALDAPVTDIGAGPIVIWFRSDGGYVGRGFRLQYQQNNC